jgi:DNA-binding MarR family transcriptional regulator
MSSTDPLDFGILLNIAYGTFKAGLHEHLARAGFDDVGTSFGYVFRTLEAGPINLRQLADLLAITPQGALKLVNSMVDKGYVERHGDTADGRVKQLALTGKARKVIAEARRYHASFERGIAERMGADKAAVARAVLEDILSSHAPGLTPGLRPF